MFYLVCKNSDNPGMSWIHQFRTEKSLIFTPKHRLSFPIFSYASSGSKSGSEPTSFIEPVPFMTVTFSFIPCKKNTEKRTKHLKKQKQSSSSFHLCCVFLYCLVHKNTAFVILWLHVRMHEFFILRVKTDKSHCLIMLYQFIFWKRIDINRLNADKGF